ncbi:MAG: 4Fe-4S binding protein [Proteobacteria bacterium]|jgi:UDP-glucose 4-epimerase|nr:4Fe-4S binding protein [Pseudomonadota bacterium]
MDAVPLTKLDEKIAKFSKNRTVLRTMLAVIRSIFRVISLPGIRDRHSWVHPEKNMSTVLPINKELKQNGVLVPVPIVSELINKSSYRMIMNVCGCRQAYDCKNHSAEIGCLFMGESVRKILRGLGRPVSREEAIAHLHRAIDNGLVPAVGKANVDTFLYQLPSDGKFVSVCFCCHCCCLGGAFKNLPAEHFNRISPRLEGLKIEVTDTCTGCGTCVEYCLYEAITIEDGRAVHSEICRGCGRCATYCPANAVSISLNNSHFKDDVLSRISRYGDVS